MWFFIFPFFSQVICTPSWHYTLFLWSLINTRIHHLSQITEFTWEGFLCMWNSLAYWSVFLLPVKNLPRKRSLILHLYLLGKKCETLKLINRKKLFQRFINWRRVVTCTIVNKDTYESSWIVCIQSWDS